MVWFLRGWTKNAGYQIPALLFGGSGIKPYPSTRRESAMVALV
jgi:hypothetical protein